MAQAVANIPGEPGAMAEAMQLRTQPSLEGGDKRRAPLLADGAVLLR